MALPSAVQAQVENAERIQAQLAAEQDGAEDGESPAAQAPTDASLQQQSDQAPQPQAQPDPTPAPPVDDPNSETWKSRFRSLQGMFNAEVPKLQKANTALETKVQELSRQIELLQAKAPTQEQPANGKTLVTPADVDSFGPELIDLMTRAAKDAVGFEARVLVKTVEKLQADVAALQGQIGSVTERVVVSDKDRFLSAMGALVPDWKEIDEQQGWLDWLMQVDPLTGKTRQDLLGAATNALDAERVAAFFRAYKALTTPPQQVRPTNTRQEQQRQVAPPRNRAAAPAPQPGAERIWTGREIGQFWEDVRTGRISGEAAAKVEAEINAAMEEGRVVP